MRRVVVPFIVVAGLVMLVANLGASAKDFRAEKPSIDSRAEVIVIQDPPDEWIGAPIRVTDLIRVPDSVRAAPAADQCSNATPLALSFNSPANGGLTLTNGYTEEPSDPDLVCLFGQPNSTSGFRTAWYQLVADDTSQVTLTTEGTGYDTVLGVYTGDCASLISIACSDDIRGFQSSVTIRVIRGQTYLIKVADYKPGVPESAFLELSAVMRGGGQFWSQAGNSPVGGVSRHALVSQGPNLYIIGGQTQILGIPVISNRLMRYNASLDEWVQLADVPGSSLSNTTAVRLGNRIYIPGGFNGNTSTYVNVHLVYDIGTDFWDRGAPIPADLLPESTMFAWAAAAAAPDQQSYFLTGGQASYSDPFLDPSAVVVDKTYQYTPSTNQWTELAPMTDGRYGHVASWIGGRGLCVAGGLSTGVDPNSNNPVVILFTGGECLNLATGVWQPTGRMAFPRYNAGSAIGPDGNWYVFGGMDARGAVPETEVYDPVTNTWRVLDGEFSLGGRPDSPARAWPRGAFVGNSLFVFGGNTFPERRVISSVDRLTPGQVTVHNPNIILMPFASTLGVENFLGQATGLPIGTTLSGNFEESTQFYNAYYFDWPVFGRATVRLGNIPADSNFNIAIYDGSKVILGEGNKALYGGEKVVGLTLEPGRYWIVVERIYPRELPDRHDFYNLVVN